MKNKIFPALLLSALFVMAPACRQGGVSIGNAFKGSSSAKWDKLMAILDVVDANYVDEIDYDDVMEKLLPLVMEELDPHSVYLAPRELQTADEDLQGGFDGIGIQFTVPQDTALISSVIAGGPSEKAGILSGDRIVSVDTINIAGVGMPQDSMVRLMRGPKGTVVKIGILREGEEVSFEVERDKIPVKSVDVAFMLNKDTGYIKLSKFAKTTTLEFLKAVLLLRAEGMKRLVFDLRDNTGGYLDQALLLCNEFLEQGQLMVYIEGAHRDRQDIHADGKGFCRDIDLAVLINESSASSSEIFAGAMQDNDRATIYGLRSFGKGVVQEPFYLSDGSGIRLTVARYHTPTGRCIQKPFDDYGYDILERYKRGEMLSADSIKVNDSLRYETPGGKVVYGGGGITPDVFVPLDTVGVTDFLVQCNRKSLQVKFANRLADENRARLRELQNIAQVRTFVNSLPIKERFLEFAAGNDVVLKPGEWVVSGDIVTTQIKALLARATPLGDDAFYPIWLTLDSTVKRALQDEIKPRKAEAATGQ